MEAKKGRADGPSQPLGRLHGRNGPPVVEPDEMGIGPI